MNESPSVRGICSFTSAMMIFADSAGDLVKPTSTPSEQNPCSSGGETWISATSTGSTLFLNNSGNSESKTGVKSARPS